jgi:putative heme iron utilization protein
LNEQLADEMAASPDFKPDASGPWRISGLDPDGADLLHRSKAFRVEFGHRVTAPREVRGALRAALQADVGL